MSRSARPGDEAPGYSVYRRVGAILPALQRRLPASLFAAVERALKIVTILACQTQNKLFVGGRNHNIPDNLHAGYSPSCCSVMPLYCQTVVYVPAIKSPAKGIHMSLHSIRWIIPCLVLGFAGSGILPGRLSIALAHTSNSAALKQSDYSPPVPIGPSISPKMLRAQDLTFKALHPGNKAIGALKAIKAAMKSLIVPGHAPSNAYIVAVRFGRINRTRSPIANYDNHLVWIVEVSGVPNCSPCTPQQKAMASYEVIGGRSAKPLFAFQATQ